jgi:hypothetical protein
MNLKTMILLSVSLGIVACGQESQPTDFALLLDKSASGPNDNERFTAKAGAWVRDDFLRAKPAAGDRVVAITIGRRDTENSVADEVTIDRQNRPAAVAGLLQREIANMPRRADERQGATNILFQVQNGNFKCSPRSIVWIVSDGIESSDAFLDVGGLLSGMAHLPDPKGKPLEGCNRIVFLGLGMTAKDAPQLSPAQIEALKTEWTRWSVAAGAKPEAITIKVGL